MDRHDGGGGSDILCARAGGDVGGRDEKKIQRPLPPVRPSALVGEVAWNSSERFGRIAGKREGGEIENELPSRAAVATSIG